MIYNCLNIMSQQSNLKEKYLQFVAQQQLVGISLQAFKQKFVFNQNSGPDAIFLDINCESGSQLVGMTKEQQNICVYMMSQMLFKAGQMLQLPVSTTVVALNICQYYYTRKSFIDYDFRQICMGAMFLACKSQQTLRRSYQIASVFDYVLKMYEGIRTIRQLQISSLQYSYMKDKVSKTQNQILFELGFELYKLFDIPHRYISTLIYSFNKHKRCNQIVQSSWAFLNDIYRTKASIHYPGQVIASAAVFMALQKLQLPLPQKPFWILMESSIQQIKHICILTNEMYQATKRNEININKVSQILQKAGNQSLKVSNVFPVPYYRKISLQNQGLFKKSIQQPIKTVQMESQDNYKHQMMHDNGKPEGNQNQKSKKDKKKNKKKQKSRNRSKSRGQQGDRTDKKGKFQNDDETPKTDLKKSTNNHTKQIILIKVQQGKRDQRNGNLNQPNIPQALNDSKQKTGQDESDIKQLREQISTKKTSLLDAKSMLSKISLQIRKIQVKNQMVTTLNSRNQQHFQSHLAETKKLEGKPACQMQDQKGKQKQEGQKGSNSSSQQQDDLLAQLIQIKKKNLLRKQQKPN